MTNYNDSEIQSNSNITSQKVRKNKNGSTSSKDSSKPNDRMITVEELQQHTTAQSIWINIDKKVYDVTQWVKHHPGGELAITNVAGRDVSDLVRQLHKPEAWESKVKHWCVGNLVTAEDSGKTSSGENIANEFRQL